MDVCEESTSGPPAKKMRHCLTPNERAMVKSVYQGIRTRNPEMSVVDAVELCAGLTKVSIRTIFRILKDGGKEDKKQKGPKPGRKKIVLDNDTKYAIRRKIHGFFFRNEFPTLKKIMLEISTDDSLPKISYRVLKRTLREINIRYLKRNRKSILIEKDEIVLWRRKYLENIRQHRQMGKKIYYTDETWLNEGHTVSKVWQDLNVKSSRQAFLDGFSTGLKAPSGKGRRLIITHIGSDSGFLDGGLSIFESRKTGDYHEDMNAEVFEMWFSSILMRVEPGSVIVMDNASYHSRRIEKIPTSASRKAEIMNWLKAKNLQFDETMLKVQLLDIVRVRKSKYIKYATDEMARELGITVLRLPPYHCELNPIELIWAQVKNEVASKNQTFKLKEIKGLLENAMAGVTPDTWQKCIGHTQKEEQKMWDLDTRVEATVEPLIITPGVDSSDEDESDVADTISTPDISSDSD